MSSFASDNTAAKRKCGCSTGKRQRNPHYAWMVVWDFCIRSGLTFLPRSKERQSSHLARISPAKKLESMDYPPIDENRSSSCHSRCWKFTTCEGIFKMTAMRHCDIRQSMWPRVFGSGQGMIISRSPLPRMQSEPKPNPHFLRGVRNESRVALTHIFSSEVTPHGTIHNLVPRKDKVPYE